jgi:hypothetical protein
VKDYYANPAVRRRIIEYLGGDTPETATCIYLTRCDVESFATVDRKKPADLAYFLDNNLDLGRSLLDRRGAVAHLDIEYVNFDFSAEAYLDPERSFHLQEPVITGIKEFLAGYGIEYLHSISGRGHHFVWQVLEPTAAFKKLAALPFAGTPECHNTFNFNDNETVLIPHRFVDAFAGMGLLMDFIALRVKERTAARCELPVALTAVEAGPGRRGREIISIDISEYGDCPTIRMIRVPFSIYLKPLVKDIGLGPAGADAAKAMVMIPAESMGAAEIIEVMRDPRRAAELARHTSVRIPETSSSAMEELIDAYLDSELRQFHQWFYSQEHEPHEQWPRTYDRTPLDMLPFCVREILDNPNDLLLIPGYIQMVVRSMLALGWHPRHIAGLIRSKYERDYGWGWYWLTYDAASRADFYTRIFAGQFVTGVDDLVDFNCLSTQEKQLCFLPGEHCTLDLLKKSLLARRKHGRLASRPFNGVFLPDEHL